MKKITATALFGIILLTVALLILAPEKATEKNVVDKKVINIDATSVPTSALTNAQTVNSSQTQNATSVQVPQQPISTHYEEVLPLPSPFIVAVLIIGSVAISGLIFSLSLRKRSKRGASVISAAVRVTATHRKMDD